MTQSAHQQKSQAADYWWFFLLSFAIRRSNDFFWHFWLNKSTFRGVSMEKSIFSGVSLGSGGNGLSLPEKHPQSQFSWKLRGGTGSF